MDRAPRTPDNAPRHELIGLEVEVVDAADPGQVGLSGTVVDETRNTVRIAAERGERTVPKEDGTFAFTVDGERVRVDGDDITYRPADRTKKVRSW